MKRLSKQELTFRKDVRDRIDNDARPNTDTRNYFFNYSNPIYIPKRKKRK